MFRLAVIPLKKSGNDAVLSAGLVTVSEAGFHPE